ncbi:VOC family protein [Soonwooa sp.]|uniref:VOC family protein n=1 Tax=Soonwooa sp. TaxID=1938592 RepID=UPI0026203A00|nr:VOC family protein [Soonwooa sp.]
MITGLYETHIQVRDLEKSLKFYTEVLGLKFAHRDETRPIIFLWIGENKDYMLGLWQTDEEIVPRHFAFSSTKEYILNDAVNFLNQNQLEPYNFLKNGTTEPMVFAWMPALAIYFKDPDGNNLEFISLLDGDAKPELGVLSYQDWLELK